jgi:hypothetical protein
VDDVVLLVQVPSAQDRVVQGVLPGVGVQRAVGEAAVHHVPRLVGVDLQPVVGPRLLEFLQDVAHRVVVAVGGQQRPLLLRRDGEVHPQHVGDPTGRPRPTRRAEGPTGA